MSALALERGVDQVRNDLFSGRLEAFEWEEGFGGLNPIQPRVWCSNDAEQLLRTGTTPEMSSHPEEKPRRRMVLVRLGEQARPQPLTDGDYLPPFLQMMIEAVRHFKIGEGHYPKKDVLEKHFLAQKLPDGTPISQNQARYLAMFSRPPEAMSGGNKG